MLAFVRTREVGVSLRNVVSRTFPHFSQSMLTPMTYVAHARYGDCSLVRRFYSPKVRKSEIKGSSFRRFVSPKVRKSDNDIDSFLF